MDFLTDINILLNFNKIMRLQVADKGSEYIIILV